MRVVLFGREADKLRPIAARHDTIEVVEDQPDVVVCYGGDGTLLSAELQWPGVPKAPIRNSRRGHRLIPRPPEQVIKRLAEGALVPTKFMKLEGAVHHAGQDEPNCYVTAMNEVNVHMGHVNLAVRFRMWLNGRPYEGGIEIVGDGFVVSTPFGSTAYYNQITRGVFHVGVGIAFKYTAEHTSHMVMPEDTEVRVEILRGPATLAWDNSPDYFDLHEGDQLVIKRHRVAAHVLTWDRLPYPSDEF